MWKETEIERKRWKSHRNFDWSKAKEQVKRNKKKTMFGAVWWMWIHHQGLADQRRKKENGKYQWNWSLFLAIHQCNDNYKQKRNSKCR